MWAWAWAWLCPAASAAAASWSGGASPPRGAACWGGGGGGAPVPCPAAPPAPFILGPDPAPGWVAGPGRCGNAAWRAARQGSSARGRAEETSLSSPSCSVAFFFKFASAGGAWFRTAQSGRVRKWLATCSRDRAYSFWMFGSAVVREGEGRGRRDECRPLSLSFLISTPSLAVARPPVFSGNPGPSSAQGSNA